MDLRVGDALTKSRKSCAFAAELLTVEDILNDGVLQ